jgi:hypothetical protein
MNKIIFIILSVILTSCFYRPEFHKAKHKKGIKDARKEARHFK